MTRHTLLALPLVLMACVEPDAVRPLPVGPGPTGECGAADLQGLVGQSAGVLETMRFGQTTRIIRPGMGVTMDFQPGRLNIYIAEDNVIARVTCG